MKKILIIVISLICGAFATLNIASAVTENDKLVLHYYRYDGNYDGYNVWMWEFQPNAGSGKSLIFQTTKFIRNMVHILK